MADKRAIHDFSTGTPTQTSLFLMDSVDVSASSGYTTEKASLAELGDAVLGDVVYTQELETTSKTVFGGINELLTYVQNIANEYDPTATYAVGDFVTYEGVLYKCTTDISTAESWTPAHWTSTLVVDEFGTGGGASVTLGTTVPSDATGSNGDLYVQYDSVTYAVIEYFVKINGSWRKSPYSRVVALTQAEYDLITPDPTTLYIITDAQSSYQTKQDANLQTTADTIVGAINELNTGKQDAFTMGSISVNDLFTNTSNILGVDAYQIGKIVIIARLRCKGGTYDGTYINYGTFKSPYVPKSSTRFLWDKGGTGTNIIGYAESGGLFIKDSDTTSENYGYSFAYIIN